MRIIRIGNYPRGVRAPAELPAREESGLSRRLIAHLAHLEMIEFGPGRHGMGNVAMPDSMTEAFTNAVPAAHADEEAANPWSAVSVH
jgi:hypothetical protein